MRHWSLLVAKKNTAMFKNKLIWLLLLTNRTKNEETNLHYYLNSQTSAGWKGTLAGRFNLRPMIVVLQRSKNSVVMNQL